MSWSERSVRNHRRKTDGAIHDAYVALAFDPRVLETFHELLQCARKRGARLFEAPVLNGRHAGVDALVNLARYGERHLRPADAWAGTDASWRPAVSSLAHHLTCKYRVPAFLASAWYATDSGAEIKRGWFAAHSGGVSFRSLNLPLEMTRKMEHIFLASADHLPIEYAMRRAELMALGVPVAFVRAILSTRLGVDLRHGAFWRTVWMFLVANADDVDADQIGPMIDYLQAVRHDRTAVDTPEGRIVLGPPQPAFSMKGRTVRSLMRLVQIWHRSLVAGGAGLSWMRSRFEPMVTVEANLDRPEAAKRWQMLELTSSAQLQSEGAALHHCVASYAGRCSRGESSIWSLRMWQGERVKPVLTVEVDPRTGAVVQARGLANRMASGRSLELLRDWAGRERLKMAS